MTIARLRAPGMWTNSSVVSSAEFEAIDENLSHAVDGENGGTYAPANPLIIGGAGLTVPGPMSVTGSFQWPNECACYELVGESIPYNGKVSFTEIHAGPGFSIESDTYIRVPKAGKYLLQLVTNWREGSNEDHVEIVVYLSVDGGSSLTLKQRRVSDIPAHTVEITGGIIFDVANPATNRIYVASGTAAEVLPQSRLSILRVA